VHYTLYRLFNYHGHLLYIGRTDNWERRRTEHAAEKPWWPEVRQIALAQFYTLEEITQAEATAIKREYPRHNKNGLPQPAGSIIDRSAPIAWTCDHCEEPITPGKNKGGVFSTQPTTDDRWKRWWYILHNRCSKQAHKDLDRYYDISEINTTDGFLRITWLVIDLLQAEQTNWPTIINRARDNATPAVIE
jgi:predicted GIY-YIG superfamily endonuclease